MSYGIDVGSRRVGSKSTFPALALVVGDVV